MLSEIVHLNCPPGASDAERNTQTTNTKSPWALNDFIEKAQSETPSKRFTTAKDFCQALEKTIGGFGAWAWLGKQAFTIAASLLAGILLGRSE
jgi:hypothetical protein